MDARLNNRVVAGVEMAAAATFGGAVGYAAYVWLSMVVPQPQLSAYTGGAGLVAFFLCVRVMQIAPRHRPELTVSIFNVRDIEVAESDELVLTDAERLDANELLLSEADRVNHEDTVDDDAFVLDDILAEIDPESRVVRLFDRKAMPTPGQLKSRIDTHLGRGAAPNAPSDASQALSEALAELRRSLR